jgi:hypothetical protein
MPGDGDSGPGCKRKGPEDHASGEGEFIQHNGHHSHAHAPSNAPLKRAKVWDERL